MRTLIATASPLWGQFLERNLTGWGFETETTASAASTSAALTSSHPAPLALLDLELPPNGAREVCAEVRRHDGGVRPYVVVVGLAARGPAPAIVLDQGADDYLAFPPDLEELRARLEAGRRLITWQQRALGRQAEELVSLCAHCKRGRLLSGDWGPIEALLACLGRRTSHGICPDCYHARVEPELEALGCPPRSTLLDDTPWQ